MPTLADLRSRFPSDSVLSDKPMQPTTPTIDETLISDVRAGMSTRQVVEQKLKAALHHRIVETVPKAFRRTPK